MIQKQALQTIVAKHFPPVKLAWAYGSAVFAQSSTKSSNNMVDLFLVVDNTHRFHQINLSRNSSHYSGLSYLLGASYISAINELVFPVHFNSHVRVDSTSIKYGVVSEETFLEDLTTWSYLTMAGRLHKPVKFLTSPQPYAGVLQRNLVSALGYVFPKMNLSSTEVQLYEAICSLSYKGDIRNEVNLENKNKVSNIVSHNLEYFRKLYVPLIHKYFWKYVSVEDGLVSVSQSEEARSFYLSRVLGGCGEEGQAEERVSLTNRRSSVRMASYHALSSSWSKNLKYVLQKSNKAKMR